MPDIEINPYAAPSAELEIPEIPQELRQPIPGPKGIGGWLLLPMIGLFGTLFLTVNQLFRSYLPIFQNGAWEQISTPGSPRYHSLWGPLVMFELIFNVILFAYCTVLLFSFFKKSIKFPFLYIIRLIALPIYLVIDLILAYQIPELAKNGFNQLIRELIKGTLAALIWIPYFIVSVRVKNTFNRLAT